MMIDSEPEQRHRLRIEQQSGYKDVSLKSDEISPKL